MESSGEAGRVHITHTTLACLGGEYEVEPSQSNHSILRENQIRTFFIVPPTRRRRLLLFNTLKVQQRRKLSFKNVSNVVIQLLHSMKFGVEVPFANMAIAPGDVFIKHLQWEGS